MFDRPPGNVGPGEARLHLRAQTIAVPGAPFVIRRMSPMKVPGGGITAASSAVDDGADSAEERERRAVLAAIAATGLTGATPAQIGAAANLAEAAVELRVGELVADGRARLLMKPRAFVAAGAGDDLLARTSALLERRQRERPWNMGVTSLGLAQALALPEPTLVRVLALFAEAGALVYRSGYYATGDFQPRLAPEQREFFDRAFATQPGSTTTPVAFEELRALIRTSAVRELSQAFETLVACGALAKVGDFVYNGSHIAAIRVQLETALRQQGRITVAEFRTLTGTSRKYAVPLLEFFDAAGVTLRTGDWRVLRDGTDHESRCLGVSID